MLVALAVEQLLVFNQSTNILMDKEILKKQINKGNSSRKIAESLGKSQTTVRYWLKKHNLKTNILYIKPHLCEDCGEADPNNFYTGQNTEM